VNIESELSHLLRRREPPPGFAERVLERIRRTGSQPVRRRLESRRYVHRALAAATLLAIALGGWGLHVTLRARDEVLTAMRIASQKVAHAQREVRGVSR
jgi:cytochrome c-type biogenesis protein CcmH/NrfG